MPLRNANDTDPAIRVMRAILAVVPPNTQWAVSGQAGSSINAWSALYGASGTGANFPFLMIEEDRQRVNRVGVRTWQGDMRALLHYIDRWDRQPTAVDVIWSNIDTDLRRMKANLEDNPTLSVQLSDEGTVTRHAVRITHIDLTPYAGSMNLGIYPFGLVARTLDVEISVPPYIGVL